MLGWTECECPMRPMLVVMAGGDAHSLSVTDRQTSDRLRREPPLVAGLRAPNKRH